MSRRYQIILPFYNVLTRYVMFIDIHIYIVYLGSVMGFLEEQKMNLNNNAVISSYVEYKTQRVKL